ncbi:MAG: prepilin-type N-terminal cleavage/methylation domain-containing protein [Candidatus Omnitrophica bacterium]|nr:prepilin-type N-terminal cleavage/methylation domain-containing protein [Candidatus Omnitrophota bacterium]
MTKKSGFTLMELMIVVVIIGILASISIPGYQKTTRNNACRQARAQLIAFSGANTIWRAEQGRYYNSSGNLTVVNPGMSINLVSIKNMDFMYNYTSTTTYNATYKYTTAGVCDFTLDQTQVTDSSPLLATRNPSCAGTNCPD